MGEWKILDSMVVSRRTWGISILVIALAVTLPGAIRAEEPETREFAVFIDGKRAGKFHLIISPQADGSTVVSARADVHLNYLIYRYTYSLSDSEVWKDGALQRLTSSCNDDGNRYSVSATANGGSLHVRSNRRQYIVRPDVWTSTYWQLPDARYRNQNLPLLDSDTGRTVDGSLHYLGTGKAVVAGQAKNCAHYQVRGLVPADLWFDEQERLVRQEGMEDGHRTLLELEQIRR